MISVTRVAGNIAEEINFEHPMDYLIHLMANNEMDVETFMFFDKLFSGGFDDDM